MKLYFFLLFPIILSAQSIDDKIRNEVCICLTEKVESTPSSLSNCVKNIFAKNKTEIGDHLKNKTSDSTDYQKGHEYITNLLDDNQEYFFKNCENYFKTINNARNKGMNSFFIKSCSSEKKDEIIKSISQHEQNASIKNRSICYLVNQEYEQALTDLNNLITKNPSDYHSYLLKAWCLEKTKRYSEASKIYFKIHKVTNDKKFKLLGQITNFLNNQL